MDGDAARVTGDGAARHRSDVVLVPAAPASTIAAAVHAFNDVLDIAGQGRPVHAPAGEFAGPLVPLPVDADAAGILATLRAHGSELAASPAPVQANQVVPDLQIEVQTLVAAGRKQGHGDPGRMPVMVYAPAPPWRREATGAPGARRPVVAVPDTGVTAHPWLAGLPEDPVVVDGTALGWSPPTVAGDGPFRGHATFLAGVIRQSAPDARVLSVPVMGDDGLVAGSESLRALTWLADLASSGDADRFVDVICLAYGYQPGPDDAEHTALLREVLWRLADRGVLIVASAGNQGSPIPTFPAAFAGDPSPPATPLSSAGATNPDGTYALYSNFGAWVTHRAVGSGVISTITEFDDDPPGLAPLAPDDFPQSIGSVMGPDNFLGGFARWSGTSFAAAEIAGLLARALGSGPALGDVSPPAAIKRAAAALEAIAAYRRQDEPGAR